MVGGRVAHPGEDQNDQQRDAAVLENARRRETSKQIKENGENGEVTEQGVDEGNQIKAKGN